MHIGVGRVGHLVIDDRVNGVDVESAGRDVGRDEHLVPAALESLDRDPPLILAAVGVQRRAPHAGRCEAPRQPILLTSGNGNPNSATDEFFFNLKDNSATHDKEPFVVFGEVIEGMAVADALCADYGENAGGGIRAGHQDPVFEGGNEYLKGKFPLLDYIKTARVIPLSADSNNE